MSETIWHERLNRLKIVVEKYCLEMWTLFNLLTKNIFTVSIQHNPQNDRLYASVSSTSQETAFAHYRERVIHLPAYDFAKCSPI